MRARASGERVLREQILKESGRLARTVDERAYALDVAVDQRVVAAVELAFELVHAEDGEDAPDLAVGETVILMTPPAYPY